MKGRQESGSIFIECAACLILIYGIATTLIGLNLSLTDMLVANHISHTVAQLVSSDDEVGSAYAEYSDSLAMELLKQADLNSDKWVIKAAISSSSYDSTNVPIIELRLHHSAQYTLTSTVGNILVFLMPEVRAIAPIPQDVE
jgi:hypothetical protein